METSKRKILVVDDDQDLFEMVKEGLELQGDRYEVDQAKNGEECFHTLTHDKLPNLILLDIMMPGINGWDVLARIRQNQTWSKIPVVFLTAKADETSKGLGNLTADDYVVKPFSFTELKRVLSKILDHEKVSVKTSNSIILKEVLISLLKVTSSKTSQDYAHLLIATLLQRLEKDYEFLKDVRIEQQRTADDLQYGVYVAEAVDAVESEHMGRFLRDILEIFHEHLGKQAGYFFIRELRDNLSDDSSFKMREMGVDVCLEKWRDELYGWNATAVS
jgi:DNA-binding response OmpR family regulator